jgi:Flp pilus assembly protein TadD
MDLLDVSRRAAGIGLLLISLAVGPAHAKDLRITIPKRTKPTPVQQLNRDGVRAVERHQYDKAKKLFYKAYLIDPNDPFTLNNLGYVSELEGDVERAQRYYDLASQQESDALVDASNDESLKGKPVANVAGNFADTGMQINRLNVQAIGLIEKDRSPEADLVLQKALSLAPKNPFTLNNMGFAKEKEGELESALSYYNAAAAVGSSEPVVVSINKDWRGKPISEVASNNAKKLRKDMANQQTLTARVARLNLQGVSAINRNDRRGAKAHFQQAYELDPNDAFTLNNMGYLAEMDGDKETADFYYAKAAEAKRNNAKVDIATRRDMEGRKLSEVADFGDQKVSAQMEQAREARAREGGAIQLKNRDNTPVADRPRPPAAPAQNSLASPEPQPTDGAGSTMNGAAEPSGAPDLASQPVSAGGTAGTAASGEISGGTGAPATPSAASPASSAPVGLSAPANAAPTTKPSRPPVIPPLPDEQAGSPAQPPQ